MLSQTKRGEARGPRRTEVAGGTARGPRRTGLQEARHGDLAQQRLQEARHGNLAEQRLQEARHGDLTQQRLRKTRNSELGTVDNSESIRQFYGKCCQKFIFYMAIVNTRGNYRAVDVADIEDAAEGTECPPFYRCKSISTEAIVSLPTC